MSKFIHNNVIPSFYGRLYAINSSFSIIAGRMGKDGKRAERGDSPNHNNVCDTLDLLELLFIYGQHPNLQAEHIAVPHHDSEWGRMMEKDLMVDATLAQHAEDWILFYWRGELIGGTSPYTLVYTVPDIRNKNIQLKDSQGRYLFDGHNQPLTRRDLRFQQYMVSLYRNHAFPASSLQSYMKEIEKLLTHDPIIRQKDFEELPFFYDIPGVVVNGLCLKCSSEAGNTEPEAGNHGILEERHKKTYSHGKERRNIFISYKRVDKEKVFKLKERIDSALYENCWIDTDGIESDAQFINVIISAINHADIILFMYSQAHTQIPDIDEDWTIRELNFAKTKKKRIIFLNLDKTPLTDWFLMMFGTKQQIDATSDTEIQKLIKDLAVWLGKEVEPTNFNQT